MIQTRDIFLERFHQAAVQHAEDVRAMVCESGSATSASPDEVLAAVLAQNSVVRRAGFLVYWSILYRSFRCGEIDRPQFLRESEALVEELTDRQKPVCGSAVSPVIQERMACGLDLGRQAIWVTGQVRAGKAKSA